MQNSKVCGLFELQRASDRKPKTGGSYIGHPDLNAKDNYNYPLLTNSIQLFTLSLSLSFSLGKAIITQ